MCSGWLVAGWSSRYSSLEFVTDGCLLDFIRWVLGLGCCEPVKVVEAQSRATDDVVRTGPVWSVEMFNNDKDEPALG